MKLYFEIQGSAFRTDDVLAVMREENYELQVQLRGVQEPVCFSYKDEETMDAAYEEALREWCAAAADSEPQPQPAAEL